MTILDNINFLGIRFGLFFVRYASFHRFLNFVWLGLVLGVHIELIVIKAFFSTSLWFLEVAIKLFHTLDLCLFFSVGNIDCFIKKSLITKALKLFEIRRPFSLDLATSLHLCYSE